MSPIRGIHWMTMAWFLGGPFAITTAFAAAQGVSFGPADTRSVFIVAKSQNKNQVHYGVHLDASCRPLGLAPVFGYWRMFEQRGEIEPMLDIEESAYGLTEGQTVERTAEETTIRVSLRAFPDRPLVISIRRVDGRCETVARTVIAGVEADLVFVYAKIRWPFGIEYLLLHGRDPAKRPIEERVAK